MTDACKQQFDRMVSNGDAVMDALAKAQGQEPLDPELLEQAKGWPLPPISLRIRAIAALCIAKGLFTEEELYRASADEFDRELANPKRDRNLDIPEWAKE